MSDPKRLALQKALTDYLQREVSEGNGYQHDLGDRVFRGRAFFSTDDPLPVISILEDPTPDRFAPVAGNRGPQHGVPVESYVLLLQGWADEDKRNPTDPAHRLMADVRMALAKLANRGESCSMESSFGSQSESGASNPDYLLGGLMENIVVEPGVVRPPTEQVSDTAFFWMRVVVSLSEDPNNPYDLS